MDTERNYRKAIALSKESKMNAETNIRENNKTFLCFFKEYIMDNKISKLDLLVALILLCSIILSACGSVPIVAGVVPVSQIEVETEPSLPLVLGPEAAREAALDFVRKSFGSSAPSPDLIWIGGKTPSTESVGSSTFQYVTDDWAMRVSFSLVTPQETIYSVEIRAEGSGFVWEGLVDAYGQVVTTSVDFEKTPPTHEVVEVEPTPTSEPTPTQEPTPIPNLEPCNAVKFVADITVPDGTNLAPEVDFTKVWRLKNAGGCAWNSDYGLIFIDGAQMGASKAVALSSMVKPGEIVDVSVGMTSPSKEGEHFGYWMLRSDDGEIFGLGENANKSFWINIQVDDPGSSTPPPEKISTWEGYIWGTEHGAQFDDYFERTDLGQTLFFGIESLDAEIQEMIETLRDSGKKVRLEGTLYSNVIDYNGSQIWITQIEILD
jgi:hypothetical protein